jgi:predicted transcriptional regulator of viral defense system
MDYRPVLARLSNQPLSHQLLVSIFKEYERPNDKIYQLAKEGVIQSIKKGLYVVGPALNVDRRPEPFLLANHILGPSYVSVETALSYHGIIPERVYEIASMTTQAPRNFNTPLGTFTYTRLSLPYYSFGIRSEKLADDQYAMVASAEKALCDKIITTSGLLLRSKKAAEKFLLENMRMDEEILKRLNAKAMSAWIKGSLKEESLSMVVYAIQEL